MRRTIVAISALILVANPLAAAPLQANDTMKSWRNSSEAERSNLIDQLLEKLSGNTKKKEILECLDDAATISGHMDLQISDVVEACKSPGKVGEPV